MVIFVIVATIIALTTGAPANERANEYDYEDESDAAPAPPAPASRGRLSVLNTRGSRGPLLGNRGVTTKQTTSKPTESPEPAEPESYDDEAEGAEDDVPATTTTEAPKKSLVRGGVRPFRSNEDLLAALKRRREQQLHGGSPKVLQVYPTPSSTLSAEENKTTRSTASQSRTGRRGFNGKASAAAGSSSDPVVAEQPESSRRTSSRKFSSRSKPVENTEVEAEETTQRAKTTFRRRN